MRAAIGVRSSSVPKDDDWALMAKVDGPGVTEARPRVVRRD